MQTLVLRCDANSATGLGHLARCRDLARLLRQQLPELRLVFAGDFTDYGHSTLAPHAFEVFALARGEQLLPDQLGPALGREARLLVDSYRLDPPVLDALAAWPAPWGVFDDFGHFDYAGAALVINTRVGASVAPYRAEQAAAGPSYFPATPELQRARAQRSPVPATSPSTILVFIGGHDQYRVGPELARAAADTFPAARVVCVQEQPLADAGSRIEQRPLSPDLSPLIAEADLVLAGGGRLKYEALFCQVPCASVSQTTGQAEDTAELARHQLCVDLGACAQFDRARVSERLAELWQPPALAAMQAAQAREFPADAGERLARLTTSALKLA